MRVDEIARLLGSKLRGEGGREIHNVAALESAGPGDLTFAEGERALARAPASRAGCILVPEGASVAGQTTLAVANPKLAFIRAVALVCPPSPATPGIHPTAIVGADAQIASEASVGPYVVIERGVKVGARTRLGAGVFLGEGVEVGSECILYPRVTVYAGARIGNRVILHSGVVAGSDGFGYVFAEGRHHKFPQLGQVKIEDDVEIGSNSTVDRGSLGKTVIGEGSKLDNMVHVAHNVTIGRHCVIAGQAGIAGSTAIGSHVTIAGQVGVADHVRVEDNVTISAKTVIYPGKIVRKGAVVCGIPGRPLAEFKRQQASVARLPELAQKVKELYRRAFER